MSMMRSWGLILIFPAYTVFVRHSAKQTGCIDQTPFDPVTFEKFIFFSIWLRPCCYSPAKSLHMLHHSLQPPFNSLLQVFMHFTKQQTQMQSKLNILPFGFTCRPTSTILMPKTSCTTLSWIEIHARIDSLHFSLLQSIIIPRMMPKILQVLVFGSCKHCCFIGEFLIWCNMKDQLMFCGWRMPPILLVLFTK